MFVATCHTGCMEVLWEKPKKFRRNPRQKYSLLLILFYFTIFASCYTVTNGTVGTGGLVVSFVMILLVVLVVQILVLVVVVQMFVVRSVGGSGFAHRD